MFQRGRREDYYTSYTLIRCFPEFCGLSAGPQPSTKHRSYKGPIEDEPPDTALLVTLLTSWLRRQHAPEAAKPFRDDLLSVERLEERAVTLASRPTSGIGRAWPHERAACS
jgi:hypothetical protein